MTDHIYRLTLYLTLSLVSATGSVAETIYSCSATNQNSYRYCKQLMNSTYRNEKLAYSGANRNQETSFYIGVSAGSSHLDIGKITATGNYTVDPDDTYSSVHLGYSLSENLSLDINYADTGELTVISDAAFASDAITSTGAFQAKLDHQSIGLNGTVHFPVTDSLDLQLTAGAKYWEINADLKLNGDTLQQTLNGVNPHYGIVVQYEEFDNIKATISHGWTGTDPANGYMLSTTSAGASIHF